MQRRTVSGIMLTLLLISLSTLACNAQLVKPESKVHLLITESKGAQNSKAIENIAIIVQKDEYTVLKPYLKRYALDIVDAFNFKVRIFKGSWSNPRDVRSKLQKIFRLFNITGCILVGNIPIASYRTEYDIPEGHMIHVFPSDLYYMDLDGTWVDQDGDGIFEDRVDPDTVEIWVSRIKPPIDDLNLITDYFVKNHDYRTGRLEVPKRAFIFQENDGEEWGPVRVEWLKALYDPVNILALYSEDETTRAKYIDSLNLGHEFLFINAHGSPYDQYIEEPSGSTYFTYLDAKNVEKGCIFNLLFSCNTGRYTVDNYIAGWYVFGNGYGLSALASTTNWESIDPLMFINELKDGYVGNAFLKIIKHADILAPGDPIVARDLYYGATLIGDPILQLGD